MLQLYESKSLTELLRFELSIVSETRLDRKVCNSIQLPASGQKNGSYFGQQNYIVFDFNGSLHDACFK